MQEKPIDFQEGMPCVPGSDVMHVTMNHIMHDIARLYPSEPLVRILARVGALLHSGYAIPLMDGANSLLLLPPGKLN